LADQPYLHTIISSSQNEEGKDENDDDQKYVSSPSTMSFPSFYDYLRWDYCEKRDLLVDGLKKGERW